MNWSYVSGFFDADGSISAIMGHKGKNKTIQISFHNSEKIIIDSIREFIEQELGFRGSLSVKQPKKETHSIAYDLKYSYQQGYKIALKLRLLHPKKIHRIKIYKRIQAVTKRNGKYTNEEKLFRENLIKEFFNN